MSDAARDAERAVPGEEPLVGDGVTAGIVRIGDTVRRPLRPFSMTIQGYLAHLQQAGFTGAPIPLGIDEQGREVLSYVPGDVPREPLPPETASEAVLVALAVLIRRLHDAAVGWVPPRDATWFSLPGSAPEGSALVIDQPELIGHRDYCPGNVVFRDGVPVALIDFDLAKPTSRLLDAANALYWWGPLIDPIDRAPAFQPLDVPRRVTVFADAYGFSDRQRREFVPLATEMIRRMHVGMRGAAKADPVFARFWEQGVKNKLPRAQRWIGAQGPAISSQLNHH